MLQENVPLHQHANYRIGGPARYFWRAKTLASVKQAIRKASQLGKPLFILGGGTNLLISDKGFDGLVLKMDLAYVKRNGNSVIVGAGMDMAKLLNFTIKEKLTGLEWAGGLPGTVGGAVRGNAGAFGGEIKDNISTVRSVEVKTGRVLTRGAKDCRFKYRSSIFKDKKGGEIIVEVVFSLKPGDPREIKRSIEEKIRFRNERHPMEYPNIGSMFKNVAVSDIPEARKGELVHDVKTDPIPVIPTARLLTQAGLKGVRQGGAMFSEKHPNFIVNVDHASAEDVAALLDLAKRTIKEKFSVTLVEEVERL